MRWKVVKQVDHEATGLEWRAIRERKGISLRNLAQTMGVRNWTEEVENRYASALGVEPVCHQLVELQLEKAMTVEGKGLVLVVRCDRDRNDFDDLLPHVMVDGEVYMVRAVEHTGTPIRKGTVFGLVVNRADQGSRDSRPCSVGVRLKAGDACPTCGSLHLGIQGIGQQGPQGSHG